MIIARAGYNSSDGQSNTERDSAPAHKPGLFCAGDSVSIDENTTKGLVDSAWKLVGLNVTISSAIATGGLFLLQGNIDEAKREVEQLRMELAQRTVDRYYRHDAERDHNYILERLRRVEARDEKLEDRLDAHTDDRKVHNGKEH